MQSLQWMLVNVGPSIIDFGITCFQHHNPSDVQSAVQALPSLHRFRCKSNIAVHADQVDLSINRFILGMLANDVLPSVAFNLEELEFYFQAVSDGDRLSFDMPCWTDLAQAVERFASLKKLVLRIMPHGPSVLLYAASACAILVGVSLLATFVLLCRWHTRRKTRALDHGINQLAADCSNTAISFAPSRDYSWHSFHPSTFASSADSPIVTSPQPLTVGTHLRPRARSTTCVRGADPSVPCGCPCCTVTARSSTLSRTLVTSSISSPHCSLSTMISVPGFSPDVGLDERASPSSTRATHGSVHHTARLTPFASVRVPRAAHRAAVPGAGSAPNASPSPPLPGPSPTGRFHASRPAPRANAENAHRSPPVERPSPQVRTPASPEMWHAWVLYQSEGAAAAAARTRLPAPARTGCGMGIGIGINTGLGASLAPAPAGSPPMLSDDAGATLLGPSSPPVGGAGLAAQAAGGPLNSLQLAIARGRLGPPLGPREPVHRDSRMPGAAYGAVPESEVANAVEGDGSSRAQGWDARGEDDSERESRPEPERAKWFTDVEWYGDGGP
ncbi:uncharacterized protein BXZ73DRAFT_98026 [Epithele typhae]|uniref:uncharacterized protein n=1 Tax=Epithele typhae TaxID=378194 RepID=UPI0020076D7B|nr:uncharacterized protein BXZ73DRAFT_98026 [Epithele typhae]KAH9941638.1 hypothetical protein BXZ73DRAFT_98026 [Epithele typhae]